MRVRLWLRTTPLCTLLDKRISSAGKSFQISSTASSSSSHLHQGHVLPKISPVLIQSRQQLLFTLHIITKQKAQVILLQARDSIIQSCFSSCCVCSLNSCFIEVAGEWFVKNSLPWSEVGVCVHSFEGMTDLLGCRTELWQLCSFNLKAAVAAFGVYSCCSTLLTSQPCMCICLRLCSHTSMHITCINTQIQICR